MTLSRPPRKKRAIITGVFGQDGTILAQYLISLDYDVVGVFRRVGSTDTKTRLFQTTLLDAYQAGKLRLAEGDICDAEFMRAVIQKEKPEEFYHLAALSHVGHSFKIPDEVERVNFRAVAEILRLLKLYSPETKFYQAGTSEEFGGLNCPMGGFDEESGFNPRSPYALAKVQAHEEVKKFRSYGLFGCVGLLFNHESKTRPTDFVSRKITSGVATIKAGKADKIVLGNLDAVRDWGYAPDYVRAMWLMLQQEKPADYVVATGETASVKEALGFVCGLAGLKMEGVYECDPKFMRPSDVPFLKGNSAKIRALGWKPTKNWKEVLAEMYEHDLELQRGTK